MALACTMKPTRWPPALWDGVCQRNCLENVPMFHGTAAWKARLRWIFGGIFLECLWCEWAAPNVATDAAANTTLAVTPTLGAKGFKGFIKRVERNKYCDCLCFRLLAYGMYPLLLVGKEKLRREAVCTTSHLVSAQKKSNAPNTTPTPHRQQHHGDDIGQSLCSQNGL